MLRPRTYPDILGKALVLEAEPFITMVDDDEPWSEGLFMIIVVGLLVGIAEFIGGLLMTGSLPPTSALREALFQGWQQLNSGLGLAVDPAAADATLRRFYDLTALWGGYGGRWGRLVVLLSAPTVVIVQWLFFAGIGHLVARSMGGTGTLNKTLGATALMVAPSALRLVSIVPFVSISGLLLTVWSLLIAYRGLEVAHDLPWRKAAWATVVPPLLFLLLLALFSILLSLYLTVGGGAA